MFRSRTVFVLGAGASAEVGLPVGDALLTSICKLIDIKFEFHSQIKGDLEISKALKEIFTEGRAVTKFNQSLHAAWQVISSAQQGASIDYIVDSLEDADAELVAKLGIVRAIHQAEKNSSYFRVKERGTNDLDFSRFRGTWYNSLTQLVTENRRRSEIDKVFENLSFVSFNYDRCIEAYLPRSVANMYGLRVDDVLKQFESVPMHRPYGIAGGISWDATGRPIGFGGVEFNYAQYLVQSSNQIRTFAEQMDDTSHIRNIQSELSYADKVVFLGSAFHRQNLEVLRTPLKRGVKVLCTASSISDSDLAVIKNEFVETFEIDGSQVEFAKMYCNQLFEEYWRTLTS